jgi:hypothetical protein
MGIKFVITIRRRTHTQLLCSVPAKSVRRKHEWRLGVLTFKHDCTLKLYEWDFAVVLGNGTAQQF